MSLHPACLHDGKFLVNFYIQHPSDIRYNACNQRYWLEYYPKSNIFLPTQSKTFHLVKPSQTSEQFARYSNLVPFRMLVYPLHEDTYIHGTFNFATINNRKPVIGYPKLFGSCCQNIPGCFTMKSCQQPYQLSLFMLTDQFTLNHSQTILLLKFSPSQHPQSSIQNKCTGDKRSLYNHITPNRFF